MVRSARCRLAAVLVATVAVYAALDAVPAHAQENPAEAEACFTAAERAQPLMKQKRLREARAELEVCARDVCPKVARVDCRNWMADVANAQPSIVIFAHETNDEHEMRDVEGVRAIIDGAIFIDKVDTTPIPIDPGRHRLRLERQGAEPLELTVDVAEGEKARAVHFYWKRSWVTKPPGPVSRPTPPLVYVLGGVGLVGVGVGTYIELTALGRRSTELDVCKGTCTQARVDDVRNLTRAGDITLGAGILFLAGAGVVYLARPKVEEKRPEEPTVGVMLGPVPGGWMAGLRGAL
jgi:hypothetical protein